MDSLANAEAVRYFTAEDIEARRFGALQRRLEDQMARVNESLAFLNFGQQLIFTSGLAAALLYTANLVAAGLVPVGQIVLVSTLLMQVNCCLLFAVLLRGQQRCSPCQLAGAAAAGGR